MGSKVSEIFPHGYRAREVIVAFELMAAINVVVAKCGSVAKLSLASMLGREPVAFEIRCRTISGRTYLVTVVEKPAK